jgi:mobilome CxxCx(11)CxxC protein
MSRWGFSARRSDADPKSVVSPQNGLLKDVRGPNERNPILQLRSEAHQLAQHATATAYIFEVRANRLRRNLNRLTFVGVGVPVAVGAIVLAYGTKLGALDWLVPIALGVGCVQLVVFVWSVVAKWVDCYDNALRAVVTNRSLAHRYESLGKRESLDLSEFESQLELLRVTDAVQEESDYRQGVTDAEKRMGMHALLRHYQRECVGCKKIPTDMKPMECGVCGDYPKRWVRR